MKQALFKNFIALAAIVAVALGTAWAVRRFQKPGQLDVIEAQAMDMSQMRPPTGAAPVALALVRQGSLADTVTYTGSIAPYNEQDVSPRITGVLVSLPVYPGQAVRAGQLLARLDTSQVGPQAAQAAAQAQAAKIEQQTASLVQVQSKRAALAQAQAQTAAARQAVLDAQAQEQGAQDAVADANAGVQSAAANADYWKTEIAREKQLAEAGAVSQQEYQNESAQALGADAALRQAQAKVRQASAMVQSARARVGQARRQVAVAQATEQVAVAEIAVAKGQAAGAGANAQSARSAAQSAAVQQGYARITSPFAGVVTARPVAPGTLVQPGTIVLKVAQIDRVRVQANVAVGDLASLHVGSPVRITVPGDGGGRTVIAEVTSVFPAASGQTRTAVVEAVIPNPAHRLLPGAFVTMQISKAARADQLLVPASAVVAQGGQSYLWTASGSGSAAGQVYECVICHIHYTAAQAKKFHYKDPMEGGRLVPLKAALPPATGLTAHRIAVEAGAGDGTWTEVSADGLSAGQAIVTHGQAGLSEGARVVTTAWGTGGPQALPTAAAAMGNQTVYRCEKCGMTFSAEDAKRNNFIDPMDGGKLVPVKPTGASGAGS